MLDNSTLPRPWHHYGYLQRSGTYFWFRTSSTQKPIKIPLQGPNAQVSAENSWWRLRCSVTAPHPANNGI